MTSSERPQGQFHDLVPLVGDVSAQKDIDPKDIRTLIEMYAYKYTKGVVIDGHDYVTAGHVNRQTGDKCTIISPIDARDRSIPLQMTFDLRSQRHYSNYSAYPGREIESRGRGSAEGSRPEEEWLRDLEDFFGPLEIGVGMENYFETQNYRSTLAGDLIFMSYSGGDPGYGFGKIQMKAPLIYKGYKHSVYEPLFERQVRAAGSPDSGSRRIDPQATEIARKYLQSFPDLSADAIKAVVTTILQSREAMLSDRAIFYALARQYHPDLQPRQRNNLLEQLMKLLNEMYDGKARKFSFD